ncbi:flagellar hook-basal body protein [Mesobacillus zeae]|uniref:Flagellar hook-basal body protein n=1 Tax=Mesobacillus zeae TaxID=1917180 RepID=A0A398B0N0_9BACI|nr:flagellar hook-basal body protein [Mesobacillus zeae]RID83469.1 flagellar hook-basal body protein [Mesobacillus zeae]
MFRGFYTVASGMLAQQRRTEMLTNNMSNSNTPGFKADQSAMRAFPEMLLERVEKDHLGFPQNKTVGPINTGVYMQEAIPKFIQGDLRDTGKKTDMALYDVSMPVDGETGTPGSVFFTVRQADGSLRYTRNGNFTLDGKGFLTTASGEYVLSSQGNPIQLSSDQFTVSENGVVTGQAGETSQLAIAFAANPNQMIREGNGLFRTGDGKELPDAAATGGVRFSLKQGSVEQSNVDVSRTMTDMMTAYRAFEANQKVMQAYDRSMEKAANEIGRL